MSEQHTPVTWYASPEANGVEWGIYAGEWGVAICADAPGEGTAKANARRIVACVNACEGIHTASLAGIESVHLESILRQRDDLLAALERLSFAALCRDSTMGAKCRLIDVRAELAAANAQAQAAIARVKGCRA